METNIFDKFMELLENNSQKSPGYRGRNLCTFLSDEKIIVCILDIIVTLTLLYRRDGMNFDREF